jgi:eukaryotic-like serine/threonine-protein kinase
MDVQTQKNFFRRFLREAQAASELDHPHILSIYSYGQHEGLPYISMPYMPGGTLSEYVTQYGPLPLNVAQVYLQEIASALDYAHSNGCIHCDVKPANILLDGEGHIMLSDFGIVLKADSPGAQQSLQSPETLIGTPDYISPEQALGKPLDGRSDIYSLAVTIFFLLAGSPPFQADSPIAMALLHVNEPPPLLSTIRADLTPQIDVVIGKALSKWPEQRYQTASEFSDAFAEAVANAGDIDQFAFANKNNGGWKAITSLKPAWKRPFKFSQVMFASILLLMIITGSITTAINLTSHWNTDSPTRVQPTSPVQKTEDLLNDQDAWLTNSNYFFDKKYGRYYIRNIPSKFLALSMYSRQQFTDFHLEVTASEVARTQDTPDFFGIVLRSALDQSHSYLFEIAAWDGGQFEFLRYDLGDPKHLWIPLPNDAPTSFKANIGQSNIITVEANGNTFTVFINRRQVGKYVDRSTSAFTSGEIGLCVDDVNESEVAFSHLLIDKL